MKGLFIPGITAEMFRNGRLESIEALMAEGKIYDIDYSPWIPIKKRPLTAEEKEYFADLGYSEDSIGFMYDCELPEDGQDVLITGRYGNIEVDTFCRDDGCYFEDNCDEDDVVAWMSLPEPCKAEESEG